MVQFNDLDAMLWIGVYALASCICLLFALNRINPWIPLGVGTLALFGFIYLYPNDFQGFGLDDGPIETVELAREAFGSLIIALVLLLFGFRLRRQS